MKSILKAMSYFLFTSVLVSFAHGQVRKAFITVIMIKDPAVCKYPNLSVKLVSAFGPILPDGDVYLTPGENRVAYTLNTNPSDLMIRSREEWIFPIIKNFGDLSFYHDKNGKVELEGMNLIVDQGAAPRMSLSYKGNNTFVITNPCGKLKG